MKQNESMIDFISDFTSLVETESLVDFKSIKKPDDLIIDETKWKFLLRSVLRGKNIMLVGPSGTGKTYMAKAVSKALNRPFFYFNLGSTQDPRSSLIGNTHFSKDSGTYFSESSFVKAIQTPDAIILLDELTRAHYEAWNILITVLDINQRYLRLDEKDSSPVIHVSPSVSFISTANIGNEYTSTRTLDRAIWDRFIVIETDVLDFESEKQLIKLKCPNIDDDSLNTICKIVYDLRKEYKESNSKISTMPSTRVAIEMAEIVLDGFSVNDAATFCILPLYSKDGGIESERTYVRQLVQKYIVFN